MSEEAQVRNKALKDRLHEVIFEADTPAGRRFDLAVIVAIALSVVVVMFETVPAFHEKYGGILYGIEWLLTIFFTIEYGLRLYCVYHPWKYATSFFGIIGLIAIVPTYLSIVVVGSQSLLVIRALRLLRIFRLLKLGAYTRNGRMILLALRRSVPKLVLFISFVLLLVIIFGSVMYLIEGRYNPQFDSIPRAVYWAIVTVTTVGYGDIAPHTIAGQILASLMMLIGYAVIAVPTGIVSVEMYHARSNTQACRFCSHPNHDDDAMYCKKCGERLEEPA
jgi:voltage-gated potassium channel